MKNIIVACGGGIATSGAVAAKVNDMLDDRGLGGEAKVEAVDIKQLDMYMQGADLYISITPTVGAQEEFPIPTVSGMPFLLGMGAEEALDQIIDILKL